MDRGAIVTADTLVYVLASAAYLIVGLALAAFVIARDAWRSRRPTVGKRR